MALKFISVIWNMRYAASVCTAIPPFPQQGTLQEALAGQASLGTHYCCGTPDLSKGAASKRHLQILLWHPGENIRELF